MSFLSRSRSYQGGPYVEVFSSQGRDPLHNTKVTNKKGVRKIYDKGVRGYVIYSSTSASARLQLPKDDRKALKLSQPYFVVQVFVPVGQAFSIAMNIKDKSHTRRRLHFSSAFSDIKATPLHCQIPLISLIRGKWLNLVLNISDFVRDNFPGQAFQCIDTVEIGGISKLRKIFTLREEPNGDGDVPRHLDYPRGVDVDTQFLDSESIKDSEGVQKLREATNQIRPLTEPLVKDMAEGALAASKQDRTSNGQNGPPVRIAFGTRLPAPTSSPPKSRRSMVKGLEISISDDKAPSGPPSPVVKLPTVLSPRAKTALPVSSLLDNVQGRGRSHSRKFKRTLPAPSSKKQLQGSVTDLARNGRSNAYYDQPERELTRESRGLGDSSELQGVTFSQSLMQSSPPQQQQKARKAYSKFRYSDYTSTSPPRPSISNQQAGPQPLEDIPLNKQHTAGSSSQLSPQNSDSSDRAFDLDSSRSNWESLFTDQSMQSPGRPAMQSRISLLPLSSQYDMFGDPGDHAKHVSFDKSPEAPGVSASRSGHSKSDSMSSDTSERASQHLSTSGSHDQGRLGAVPALRRSVEFKDASETPMVSPQTSDREEEETPSPRSRGDLGRRAGGEEDLDYGLFNVSNSFGNRSGSGAPAPDLYACNSELLDDPVCLHEDDVDAFAGFPGKDGETDEDRKRASPDLSAHAISLDPLPSRTLPSAPRASLVLGAERPVTSEAGEGRHHVGHPKEAPTEGPEVPLGVQSAQTKAQVAQDPPSHHMTNHRMTYDIEHIIEKQNELSYSENSLIDDYDYESQEDLVKVEDAVKMQREMINKHRIFTPPVIPASKVVENDRGHFRPSLAAVNLSSIAGGVGDHDIVRDENADDGNTMMDLIYDPILNCYYDAKANRYYELK